MADQTWDRIKELFHAALKYPVEERAQFLAAACGDDDALRSEVADLLSAHYDLGDDSISIDHGSPVKQKGAVFPVEGTGSVIGRYRPLAEIGEGGMGVVYLAQQEQPVRRKVALKIIKLGMDTREVIARFEAERQALAIMDHGNIARVFDAGTTEMGRPYFVMEYIPGIPVTDYCDQERLSAEQRLGLFIEICHAIHHAHQKGIIHRDIKPSNVLVTVQDGKPVPKIIDFGVAKAVNRELSEKTFFTEHGMLIGTPVYMSPEQADSAGGDVDTTADVYSLGVLLYELLAGAPPFDPQSMREVGFEAIRRLIREVDPPTPSTRLSGMGSEAMVIAGNRRTRPSTLEKKIRGELDWITMRAMEKNRDRRYQSASEFAADIERYLNGEPVQAGPPGRLYRARKFVHRNKTAVGLVTTVAIFLVTVAITMTIQANRIARERDRTRLEAERARSEAEMLQGLILNDMDRMTPGTPAEVARRVRESWDLHRSSPVISDRELALWSTNMIIHLDFSIAFGRGERTAAVGLREELCSQVLRTIDEAVAEKDTSIVKTIDVLIGHYEEGVLSDGLIDLEAQTSRLYRVGLELRRQMHPSLDPELRNYLDKFASYLLRTGRRALEEERIPEAAAIFRELHTIRQETHPFPSYQGGLAKGLLGESLTKLARYAEAEPLLVESLEMHDTRDARLRLIDLYEPWGKPDVAERYRRELWVESVREVGSVGTFETSGLWLRSSCVLGGRSVWIFGDGGTKRPSRWAWSEDTVAGDGLTLIDPANGADGGRDLLPPTPGERAFNEQHSKTPEKRWLLKPGAIVADPERQRAIIVYTKILNEEWGDPPRRCVGYSIAVWTHPDSAVVRPVLRPGTEYPTLLFPVDTPDFGAGALSAGGYLYLFAGSCTGFFSCGCIVARATLSDVFDRSAWLFYAGDGRWTNDMNRAERVLSGVGALSVHWNEYLGKFLAVFTPSPFGCGVSIRMADRPEGPWSSARLITEGVRPAQIQKHNYGAFAHPFLAREGGRVEYVTYLRPVGRFGAWNAHLIEITFK